MNQHYEKYSPINQAVWRYVMRQNYYFLKDAAHPYYVDGLRKSGIKIESIPKIEEMNACLQPFGWGAVSIDGFIPGVVFFDFQSHGILPIAAEIRQLEHIEYTPAPDIIHEAAGHAPILCHPQYANYVKIFGEIGRKAIATKEEHEVFEAVRTLSALMESSNATEEDIQKAKEDLAAKQKAVTEVSEAEQISRLYWWTVEYGLIGDLQHPKIYGAGLLSSVGESAHSLTDQVKKIPFDLETAIQTGFDITQMQPQLFVCQSFEQLISAVQEFSTRMAFSVGGTESLFKALRSSNIVHVTYSSGLQATGIVSKVLCDDQGEAICFQTDGMTAFSYGNQQLDGHYKEAHPEGIIAPIGNLQGMSKPIEQFKDDERNEWNIAPDQTCQLVFEGGLAIRGKIQQIIQRNGKIILINFHGADISYQGEILRDVDSGPYTMPVGASVISVAAGAADPESYYSEEVPSPLQSESISQREWSPLEKLYADVRAIREKNKENMDRLLNVVQELDSSFPGDWLLRLEILEIIVGLRGKWASVEKKLLLQLEQLKQKGPEMTRLITNGLKLIRG
ncbi:phenylalanine-4-hydroxylase [Ammoniphilus resinae]|uniref:Phenylalanine-4-hydroxylase n=1 Tax=Ammoniphilus resinae TaxID=861532 RepID=A0ABS4GWK0_9BACL|nr:phenylalanine-4-hydroxylase [Ammoniphilus resinae]